VSRICEFAGRKGKKMGNVFPGPWSGAEPPCCSPRVRLPSFFSENESGRGEGPDSGSASAKSGFKRNLTECGKKEIVIFFLLRKERREEEVGRVRY